MKRPKVFDFAYERNAAESGYRFVCGVDEAGRGPLAGEVYAAAVILREGICPEGVDDSKKLSEKRREELFEEIKASAEAFSVAFATAEEIDSLNILNATMLAMRRAVGGLSPKAEFALIDGDKSRGFEIPTLTVIGGDGKVPSIAAASILAKVTRDRRMAELDVLYPQYGFLKNKGYGTAFHIAALREFGPCPLHRRSFLKFLSEEKRSL